MTDTTIQQIMDALANQIRGTLGGTAGTTAIQDLNVYPRLESNPTPPAIDIYPADPFIEQTAYGKSFQYNLLVRARVDTADEYAGQNLLISLMDPRGEKSLKSVIENNRTLSGTVDSLAVSGDSPSAFGEYRDSGGEGSLLGCQWTVQVEV